MSVVLIGSVARHTETPRSDVDLVILTEDGVQAPPTPCRFHIHQIDRDRMLKRLVKGDDFPAWCVRYGIPIWDSGLWAEIVKSEEARVWPDWRKKRHMQHADFFSAPRFWRPETRMHRQSALLLRAGVFPFSRAELVQQLEQARYPHLAMLLHKLIHDRATLSLIRQAQS